MAGKQEIKSRIRSVQSTRKITKAMELVATSKLQKQKKMMEANKEYAGYLKNTVSQILADSENVENVFMRKITEDTNPYTILITSDMGMCGGYNSNVLRFLQDEGNPENELYVLGLKGRPWLNNRNYNVVNTTVASDSVSFATLSNIMSDALDRYVKGEITSINVMYTKFVNSVTFNPTNVRLLPADQSEFSRDPNAAHVETLFEPSPSAILNDLIPMYAKSMLYSYYLETKTSEQASRRMAMENASDNATEIIDTLTLKYNQARQAAITQEITEIVGGANAL